MIENFEMKLFISFFFCTHSQYSQSAQTCFTFYVTENGTDTCPGVINNSTTTTPPTAILGSTTTTTIETTTTTMIEIPPCM